MAIALQAYDQIDPCSIWVGHLAPGTTEAALRSILCEYGRVVDIQVFQSFAFVRFNTSRAADQAIERENGRVVRGNAIQVQHKVRRTTTKPRGAQTRPAPQFRPSQASGHRAPSGQGVGASRSGDGSISPIGAKAGSSTLRWGETTAVASQHERLPSSGQKCGGGHHRPLPREARLSPKEEAGPAARQLSHASPRAGVGDAVVSTCGPPSQPPWSVHAPFGHPYMIAMSPPPPYGMPWPPTPAAPWQYQTAVRSPGPGPGPGPGPSSGPYPPSYPGLYWQQMPPQPGFYPMPGPPGVPGPPPGMPPMLPMPSYPPTRRDERARLHDGTDSGATTSPHALHSQQHPSPPLSLPEQQEEPQEPQERATTKSGANSSSEGYNVYDLLNPDNDTDTDRQQSSDGTSPIPFWQYGDIVTYGPGHIPQIEIPAYAADY